MATNSIISFYSRTRYDNTVRIDSEYSILEEFFYCNFKSFGENTAPIVFSALDCLSPKFHSVSFHPSTTNIVCTL